MLRRDPSFEGQYVGENANLLALDLESLSGEDQYIEGAGCFREASCF